MLYWLIPLIIFVSSFLVMVFLVLKKMPALAQLPEVAPTEQIIQKRKDQIIKTRFQRLWVAQISKLFSFWRPLSLKIKQLFFIALRKIQDIEARYQKQPAFSKEERKERIQKLVWEANELVNQDQLPEAEKKYLQVISWDHKNLDAYKGLSNLYWRKKDYQSAIKTLEHILRISPEDGEVYWQLASLAQEQGQFEDAYEKFEKACEIAPNNPKYLDSLLEISIILGKKDNAWPLVNRLKEVNPENQKLKDFEERIRKL